MRLLIAYLLLSASTALAAPNAWVKMSPANTTRRYPAHWVDCSPSITAGNPVGRSYSSMINGPSGKILYWGGGHASHPGNDAEIFDIATSTWTQQFNPECLDACCRVCSNNTSLDCAVNATCVSPGTCGTALPLCGTVDRCATYPCSCIVMNGSGTSTITTGNRPYVEHSYSAYAYNANASRQHYLFSLTSGVWSYSPPDTWTRLTATQPNLPSSPWCGGKLLAYDPTITCGSDTGSVLMFANPGFFNGGIYCFNYTTNAWVAYDTSATAFPTGLTANEITGTWDSSRNEHIISSSWDGIWRYKASTKTWTNTNAPTGALQTLGVEYNTAVAYDASHDITVALKPTTTGPDMWQYNNATGVWANIDDSQLGSPPFPPQLTLISRWNLWRYDGGTFYLLSDGSTSPLGDGTGGAPDNVDWGTTTWSFQWNNPLLVGQATNTPTPTGNTPTPTRTRTITPTPSNTPTSTKTPTGAATATSAPGLVPWSVRQSQAGVLAAIGYHNSTDVTAHAQYSTLTGLGPVYDPVQDAAQFQIINTLPNNLWNNFDGSLGVSPLGGLVYSLPWAQQFDAGNEFEVQYLIRDDNWVFERTNKKIDSFSAGDRVDSVPTCQPSGQNFCQYSGSCLPNDVVSEFYTRAGFGLHIGYLSGYQGCSSGPAWGNSYAGQVGVDFNAFSPPRDSVWIQPAIPSCLSNRVYNQTVDPGQVCTVLGANVWEAVTLHVILGSRGIGPWTGTNYPRWTANHAYAPGYITDSNGNIQLTYSGGTSGATEPTWPTYSDSNASHNNTVDNTVTWSFYGGKTDWFQNSYFWMAFGWEGHPSTALIYRGPFNWYSPISDLSYGNPPPKVGKLWLFPYRQAAFDAVGASGKTANTITGVVGSDITELFPAGRVVTDDNTGFATLLADAHPGDTSLLVSDTSTFSTPITQVRLWQQLNAGYRWYKEMLIATGGSLVDPFGLGPISWPTPPNAASDWPGTSAPPSGLIPFASGLVVRPTPPVLH